MQWTNRVSARKEFTMKKFLVCAVLAAGALATGPALADPECQAGSAWGVKPGCGGPTQQGVPMPTPEPNVYNNSGWTPPGVNQPYANVPRSYSPVVPQYAEPRRPVERYDRRDDRRYQGDRRYEREDRRQLQPRRGDRDGDGIANQQDRYPRDPSRW
jgi:hypothetical protein